MATNKSWREITMTAEEIAAFVIPEVFIKTDAEEKNADRYAQS